MRDLVPVDQVAAGPHILIVNTSLPVQSVRDLIALAKAVNGPDVRERLAALGVEPYSRTSAQMASYLRSEIDKYGKIVRAIGLKID